MPLEDRDIFLAIYDRYADQPIEFIMEQFEKAKRLNMDIEKRIGSISQSAMQEGCQEECCQPVEEAVVEIVEQPRKKYTRRNLRVKPEDSITDTEIFCCICGEPRQSLTAKHLAMHGISVEDYKKLCGFAPDQPLMSRKRLAKSKEIIKRAQKARLDKKASMEGE